MTTVIKKVLASTLKELMEEKSLSKITINDLTQSCGVSRQTFYNNFIDIYDLVEWIYLQDTEILVGKDVTYDNWQDALASIFQYIADNRSFVLNTYRSIGKEYLEKFLNQEVERFLTNLIFQEIHVTGEEAQQAGIDFQLSGHTHHGQVWPISWITDAIYEQAFGPLQKGNTQYYISSGLGIWGGKFRIGTRSEYIVGTLHN